MTRPPSILVVGSSNTDMVVRTKDLPSPGQTVLGGEFFMNPGGKGANQAVAAARLQARVTFLTKLGADVFGAQTRKQFTKEGIDHRYVLTDPTAPSGIALISVDEKGENCIVVAPGANANLDVQDIKNAHDAIQTADILLVQLEIPFPTVTALVDQAAKHHKRIILNPAPAYPLANSLLSKITILTPNEKEAELLTGIAVIILGKNGVLLCSDTGGIHLPAPKVEALDTTAAGDVFNGALAVALAEGKTIGESARFANYAAALSVTRLGAQSSAPTKAEVEVFMQQ